MTGSITLGLGISCIIFSIEEIGLFDTQIAKIFEEVIKETTNFIKIKPLATSLLIIVGFLVFCAMTNVIKDKNLKILKVITIFLIIAKVCTLFSLYLTSLWHIAAICIEAFLGGTWVYLTLRSERLYDDFELVADVTLILTALFQYIIGKIEMSRKTITILKVFSLIIAITACINLWLTPNDNNDNDENDPLVIEESDTWANDEISIRANDEISIRANDEISIRANDEIRSIRTNDEIRSIRTNDESEQWGIGESDLGAYNQRSIRPNDAGRSNWSLDAGRSKRAKDQRSIRPNDAVISNRPLDSGRSIGPYDQRSIGPYDQRSIGPYDQRSIGPYVQRSIGPYVQRSIGPYVQRSIGPYDQRSIRPYDVSERNEINPPNQRKNIMTLCTCLCLAFMFKISSRIVADPLKLEHIVKISHNIYCVGEAVTIAATFIEMTNFHYAKKRGLNSVKWFDFVVGIVTIVAFWIQLLVVNNIYELKLKKELFVPLLMPIFEFGLLFTSRYIFYFIDNNNVPWGYKAIYLGAIITEGVFANLSTFFFQ